MDNIVKEEEYRCFGGNNNVHAYYRENRMNYYNLIERYYGKHEWEFRFI